MIQTKLLYSISLILLFSTLTVSATSIELLSFAPDPILTNYTGEYQVSYGVTHDASGLNNSSIAFLFSTNYTNSNVYSHSIRVPSNDISNTVPGITQYGNIFRNFQRNITPYLTQEHNDTITEGNIWKHGMYDYEVYPHVKVNPINDTYTLVNMTGYRVMFLEQMHYLSALNMFLQPKTPFEISKSKSLIMKFWDVEKINSRDNNYHIHGYFETSIGSLTPTTDIDIWIANNSFNPLTDNYFTSPNAVLLESWNITKWNTHTLCPQLLPFPEPLIVNVSTVGIELDVMNYIIFSTETLSSKPYIINVTNANPGITNLSWAQTGTLHSFDRSGLVATPYPYTAGAFFNFIRGYTNLEIQLYAADNLNEWAHSGIDSYPIGVASQDLPEISYNYFNVSMGDSYCFDTDMDATYDHGSINISIHCPSSPNGGNVLHTVTLHYQNRTIVSIIDDTLDTTGIEDVEFSFTTTPYYSTDEGYTLRCVSTDSFGKTSTSWLGHNFTLAADGTTGFVLNGILNFWGYSDLPTLYSAIGDSSILSRNLLQTQYTMHIPFFKSKCNDTFLIDKNLRLESNNDGNEAYFRYISEIFINDSSVCAWDTVNDDYAEYTDSQRAYLFGSQNAMGGFFNSDLSYLGSDIYRQEGINFVSSNLLTIDNCVLSHNSRGIIFENTDNKVTMTDCEIHDNMEAGIGLYFTNNSVITNNIINSNGRTGIRIYQGNNHVLEDNQVFSNGNYGYWLQHTVNNSIIDTTTYSNAWGGIRIGIGSTSNELIDSDLSDTLSINITSDINVVNSDNQVFSGSGITTYAYPNNFSSLISGVAVTTTITNRNMFITPNSDKLLVTDLKWDYNPNHAISVNTESPINITSVWFNITNPNWIQRSYDNNITIYRDSIGYSTDNADDSGSISYNYIAGYSEHEFIFENTFEEHGYFDATVTLFNQVVPRLETFKDKVIVCIPFFIGLLVFILLCSIFGMIVKVIK